jgi:thymidylate synthase (FAD)
MEVSYIDHMGSDLTVVNAARVSFAKHKEEFEENDTKLISYLAKNNHWTPFSHAQIQLRIKAPVFVRTQLFKHKVGFTENEVSRRYVDDEPEFFIPILRRRPDNGMKQGSRDEFPVNLDLCDSLVLNSYRHALLTYNRLIKEDVAPEQARMVLPQGMYTEFYWTGSLAAYARVAKLRLDPHAQGETRDVAKMISEIIEPLFPVCWRALVG